MSGRSVRQVLAFSFLDRYAGLLIHTAASMVLARLLTPAEIGVYSVAMVLMALVSNFRDMGAGQFLVRHKALTTEAMRATFTVQLMLGLLIALLLAAAAVPVARFYQEPRLRDIVLVLALNVLVTPWLAYPSAWLVREMRFDQLALIRFGGGLGHAGTAIGLVLLGQGPVSLAWANLATTVVGVVCLQALARPRLPRLPTRHGLRAVLSFGGQLSLVSVMESLRAGVLDLVAGRVSGMAVTGHLSRSQGLVAMFEQLVLSAVNQVALPYFAREQREGRSLGAPLVTMLALITGLGWSFFGGLALLAHPIVRLLYGPQWDTAVELARWLSAAAALALPGLVCQSPLVAMGAMGPVVRANAVALGLTAVAAVALWWLDILVVARLTVLAAALSTAYWLALTLPRVQADLRTVLTELLRSAGVALAALAGPVGCVAYFGWHPQQPWLVLLLAAPLGLAGLLGAAWALRHCLWQELRRLLPAGRGGTQAAPS